MLGIGYGGPRPGLIVRDRIALFAKIMWEVTFSKIRGLQHYFLIGGLVKPLRLLLFVLYPDADTESCEKPNIAGTG